MIATPAPSLFLSANPIPPHIPSPIVTAVAVTVFCRSTQGWISRRRCTCRWIEVAIIFGVHLIYHHVLNPIDEVVGAPEYYYGLVLPWIISHIHSDVPDIFTFLVKYLEAGQRLTYCARPIQDLGLRAVGDTRKIRH